jgi:hypothetical protein
MDDSLQGASTMSYGAAVTSKIRIGIGLFVTAVAVGLCGYWLGIHTTEQANWHTVTVDLSAVGADEVGSHRLLSVQDDGWTYAIEDSVSWVDEDGVSHDSGWPECLEPARPGYSARSPEKVSFRFAEVSVDTDTIAWRPVVMVDCASG